MPHNWDLNHAKRFTDCNALEARQEGDSMRVLVYEDSIMTWANWNNINGEELPISPPAFTELWNSVVEASCNELECGEHIGIAKAEQYHRGPPQTLHMWLECSFYDVERRDPLVALLRQAFDRAVVREWEDSGLAMGEWGPKDMCTKAENGDHLRFVLRTKTESEEGCGDIISRILAMGELVSPVFGVVNIACGTKDW